MQQQQNTTEEEEEKMSDKEIREQMNNGKMKIIKMRKEKGEK